MKQHNISYGKCSIRALYRNRAPFRPIPGHQQLRLLRIVRPIVEVAAGMLNRIKRILHRMRLPAPRLAIVRRHHELSLRGGNDHALIVAIRRIYPGRALSHLRNRELLIALPATG